VEPTRKKVRVRVAGNAKLLRFFLTTPGKILLGTVLVLGLASVTVFTYYWVKYSHLIDAKLSGGTPFTATSKIYASPVTVGIGDTVAVNAVASELRRSGYSESRSNPVGSYNLRPDSIEIFPGRESFFKGEAAVLHFAAGKISRIVSLEDNSARNEYDLEPRLITNLHDKNREKRRLVRYSDIPVVLRNAVLSAEDRRFLIGNQFVRLPSQRRFDQRRGQTQTASRRSKVCHDRTVNCATLPIQQPQFAAIPIARRVAGACQRV